jgi:hypothetical protein
MSGINKIGFVILSHNQPEQLERLVRRLVHVYHEPAIAIHHDFGQSQVQLANFPSNATFVSPHIKTHWGSFSVVEAALRALSLLYQNSCPDWFFLLSSADYPTMSAQAVLCELQKIEVDALLDYREISEESVATLSVQENPCLNIFSERRNIQLAWRRYVALNVWVPVLRARARFGRHLVFQAPVRDWRSPFSINFKCFFGDHWFSGNQKVADILLNPTPIHIRLKRHLRSRWVPEECYYQSVLGNNTSLNISKATKRFAKWRDGDAHPEHLTPDDLSSIIESKSFFARKFAPNTPILDILDKLV